VKYEVAQSIRLRKGLIAIDISKIFDQNRRTDARGPNPVPLRYPLYLWHRDKGRENLGKWIDAAAMRAGR